MLPSRPLLVALLSLFLTSCIVVVQEAAPAKARPAPEPERLRGAVEIPNGGFEREDGIIRPWETVVHASAYAYRFDIDAEFARTGNAGVRLRRDGNEPWGGIVQVLDVEAPTGQKGTLTAWIRSPELSGHAEFFVRTFPVRGEPEYHIVMFPADKRSAEWQQVSVEFETKSVIRRIWVGVNLYDGEHIDLDDFSLEMR